MGIRDDLKEAKEEIQELKEKSLAMELLQDARKTNKRLFIIWLVTFIAFIGLLGYTIWLLNDIGTEETIEEVTQDNESGYNNYIGNDGDITNGKADN